MPTDPTYSEPKGFSQKHLSRDETEKLYKNALNSLEAQIMGARFDEYLQDPDPEGNTEASIRRERFERGLASLEADYAAWKRKNPPPREKPSKTAAATPGSN